MSMIKHILHDAFSAYDYCCKEGGSGNVVWFRWWLICDIIINVEIEKHQQGLASFNYPTKSRWRWHIFELVQINDQVTANF